MMRYFTLISISLVLATVVPAWAENGQFRSTNEITDALNPLDVIANHDGIKRSIDLNIQFKFDSFELLPAAQRQIKVLAEAINSDRLNGYGIQIVGHTDAQGDIAHNQWLSGKRATAVLLSLDLDYGVNPNRLQSFGQGETQLLTGLATDDARHRRVEIIAVPIEQIQYDPYTYVEQDNSQPRKELPSDGNKKIIW